MSDKDLMKALGGGSSKVPGWVKVVALAVIIALAWVLAWELGLFLILVTFGGWTAWAWKKEKGNVVDSFRDFILFAALLGTALGPSMNGVATGFKSFGPAIVEAVKGRWNERDVVITPPAVGPAATTTAPPAAEAAQPVGAPR